jgi:hypothetical protein
MVLETRGRGNFRISRGVVPWTRYKFRRALQSFRKVMVPERCSLGKIPHDEEWTRRAIGDLGWAMVVGLRGARERSSGLRVVKTVAAGRALRVVCAHDHGVVSLWALSNVVGRPVDGRCAKCMQVEHISSIR